jgi:cytochrome c553
MFPKPNIPRLKGKDLSALRIARFLMDGGRCTKCKRRVYLSAQENNPRKADLAHVRNRRMHGDTISNTITMCHFCHMQEHTGGKSGKPCPKKEPSA